MDEPCKTVRIVRHNKQLKPHEPKIQPWCTVHHKWNCDRTPKRMPRGAETPAPAAG